MFGNDEDHAYGLFLLDSKSQAAVIAELPGVADPFLRALLWGALWDSVRDLRMPPMEYLELGLRLLPFENDTELTVSIVGRMRTAFTDYLSDPQRDGIARRFERLLIREIVGASTADLRITYYRGLIGIATTARARGVLHDLLAGRMTIPDVPLKQRDRWNIIAALTASGDASGEELLTAESKRDTSDDGRKYAYVSGAGFPRAENKKKYFAEYLAGSGRQRGLDHGEPRSVQLLEPGRSDIGLREARDRSLTATEAGAEDLLRGELAWIVLSGISTRVGVAGCGRRISAREPCRSRPAVEDSGSAG